MCCYDDTQINVKEEAEALVVTLCQGNPEASRHLACLFEADTQGAFQPFAEAVAARLRYYVDEWLDEGVTNLDEALEDVVYHLLKISARDWDGRHHVVEQPGEEM
jgi:hypothetical protein